jgi:hypothetical protein
MQVQDLKHLSCFQIQLQATRGNGNENDDSQCSSLFSCRPLETTTTTVTATTRLGLFHHFAAVPTTTMTTLENNNKPMDADANADTPAKEVILVTFDLPVRVVMQQQDVVVSKTSTRNLHNNKMTMTTTTWSICLSYNSQGRQQISSDNNTGPLMTEDLDKITCRACRDDEEYEEEALSSCLPAPP